VTLTPLEDKVLVKNVDDEEVNAAGIFLVPQRKSLVKAVVLAVGPGHLTQNGDRVTLDVLLGDTILYQDGHGIEYEGVVLVSATSIVAKL
jgi:chaperonin GroES